MTNTGQKMIPMAIITGYLGAGKTTLLNRILLANHNLRIAAFVNDFGAINIDQKLIAGSDGERITLTNGCICCTIHGDFVTSIAKVLEDKTPPDYIIIEANGVTDPAKMLITFNWSFLRAHIQIDSIIAILDADQFNDPNTPNDLVRNQVKVADIVIINKADLTNAEEMKEIREWVSQTINRANIFEAVECDVPLDALLSIGTYNPQTAFDTSGHGVHAHNIDELDQYEHSDYSLVFATWSWETDTPLALSAIHRTLDNLSQDIFRIKGVLYLQDMPDKQVVLQMVGNRVQLTIGDSWATKEAKTSLVVLGKQNSVNKTELQAQFEQGVAETVPKSSDANTPFIDGKLEWTRKWR